jgi:hypothetical protein
MCISRWRRTARLQQHGKAAVLAAAELRVSGNQNDLGNIRTRSTPECRLAVLARSSKVRRESRGSWSSGTPAPPSHSLASSVIGQVPGPGRERSSNSAIRAFGDGAFNAPLNCLMMQPERPSYRKRRVFPIGRNIRTRSTRSASLVRDCAIDSPTHAATLP